jgi:hypothetical protein
MGRKSPGTAAFSGFQVLATHSVILSGFGKSRTGLIS